MGALAFHHKMSIISVTSNTVMLISSIMISRFDLLQWLLEHHWNSEPLQRMMMGLDIDTDEGKTTFYKFLEYLFQSIVCN